MKFTHLHTHSHYSLLDGLAKIDDLIDRAVELKMESLALTDHGTMYGAVEFYQKAKKKGIKPIIGVEFYLAPNGMHNKMPKVDEKRYHLLLLAKNNTGYKNLIKLTSKAHLEGYYYKPRIDKTLLKDHAEGLIATSACIAGEIPKKIIAKEYSQAEKIALEYKKMFDPGCFFFELESHHDLEHQDEVNDYLIKLGKKLDIPVVAANDIHYIYKDDDFVQDILLCIQTNRQVSDKNRLTMIGENYSMKSAEEMAEYFKDIPEAIENTQKIAEMCNVEVEFGKNYLPEVGLEKYIEIFKCSLSSPDDALRKICENNINKKYFQKSLTEDQDSLTGGNAQKREEIKKRLEFELETIKKMGFAGYFLIVEDYVNWAKNNGIVVGPGRGSAAGSIVAYLTGITDLDPLKYDLLFERFLNPDRISMPDIDIDFADDRRDEVIEYAREKYGEDHVVQIITFGTMAARASVRDAGRALGYPYQFCDKTAKLIPPMTKMKDALENAQELKDLYKNDPAAKKLLDSAKRLEGVARHSSTHACGVVITPDSIDNHVPRQYASQDDRTIITQYSMKYIESIGLLKMDFLGIANLTIIQKALDIIRQEKNPEISLDDIPLDDKKTYQLFQEGKTVGVFQFESGGMKRYLKQLKPTDIEDIIAMVALYRPGPMDLIPEYIDVKHKRKQASYLHPKLEPILGKTYGVAIYQEQLLQIARDLAGFSLAEADILRRAIGKKIAELLNEQKNKFIEGCIKNNIEKGIAQKIFAFMEPFAGYGFNRSHAACYALIGYQTAYLKANYPAEFMAALLASDKDNLDRITIEVGECRQMGINILPPSINESFANFRTIEFQNKEAIRFGLAAIKNVGNNVVEAIVGERIKNGQYKSLTDLLERIDCKDLNKKSLESLAKSGAFDCIGERKEILDNMENILNFLKEIKKAKESGHRSLFDFSPIEISQAKIHLDPVEPASKKDRLLWEKELLGFYISEHPLDEFREFLEQNTTVSSKLSNLNDGASVVVGGVIQKAQKIITKSGKPMVFAPMEDAHGNYELIVFPKILEETMDVWQADAVIMARGKFSNKDGEKKVLCDKAKIISQEDLNLFKQRVKKKNKLENKSENDPESHKSRDYLTISILDSSKANVLFQQITSALKEQKPGKCQILIQIPKGSSNSKIATDFKIQYSETFISTMRQDFGDMVGIG